MRHLVTLIRPLRTCSLVAVVVAAFIVVTAAAAVAATPPQPVVAIHVSELTQALETMPATPPTPTGAGTTGFEWYRTSWHYFVGYESLKEALRSDGTPYVEVNDAVITAGGLLNPDGSPKYPILISLASEAVAAAEIEPLRAYVQAGGFLFVGSSSFTRNPDGTSRGDFALAAEMGLHQVHAFFDNWYENLHFTKEVNDRLVAEIPSGTISWRMPAKADEVPLGSSPSHFIHGAHTVFQVSADGGTTVLAGGDSGPLVARRQYGQGTIIYHGAFQPLIGHTIYDPALYAYLIYRRAIEWAFESFTLPVVKLSPLRYDDNAAFVVRHDFENYPASIRQIETSAAYEAAAGAKGDYYFCTGTLRDEMADRDAVVASLRRAVTDSGATVGSHNGGLKNPTNDSLTLGAFDYWHWGPDEALDVVPAGYASGKAYAEASLTTAFQDVEGWMAGIDNGRPGCGAAASCPRIWAAPYMNSTREESRIILEALGAKSLGTGEQKIGPFPHWALSYETPGKRFSFVSEPTSDWYVGVEIPGALEWGHTAETMQAAVDFYYNLGAPINLYGHLASDASTLVGQYVNYAVTKPRMWATNAVGIADWWQLRSQVTITAGYGITGNTVVSQATITGSADPGVAVEFLLPMNIISGSPQVFLNGAPANPSDYRTVGNTLKVRAGITASLVTVQYTISNPLPAVSSLLPAVVTAGAGDLSLNVNGSGFIAGSTVQWNGADRLTSYLTSTQLAATIPAADLVTAGTATVTVVNPTPGGGTSNGLTFVIQHPLFGTWTQTDWTGGSGQEIWTDATRYASGSGVDNSIPGEVR
ncbi:MAG: IPT/TIG domain-containing protein, partial [Nitrospiraceae bacterium]|nr:IPT/TIG domain-containing protein [Nitrospiraceae bacterium]